MIQRLPSVPAPLTKMPSLLLPAPAPTAMAEMKKVRKPEAVALTTFWEMKAAPMTSDQIFYIASSKRLTAEAQKQFSLICYLKNSKSLSELLKAQPMSWL